jgi:antitoxin YobK
VAEDDYGRAVALMSSHSGLLDFAGHKDEDLIVAAEKALGLRFPHDYRRFLAEFGAGSFGGTEIYGLIDDDFVNSSVPDAIWNTFGLREDGLPPNVVAFHATGDGEELGLVCDSRAGGPVIAFLPGAGDEGDSEVVAVDFGGWLLKAVELEIQGSDG